MKFLEAVAAAPLDFFPSGLQGWNLSTNTSDYVCSTTQRARCGQCDGHRQPGNSSTRGTVAVISSGGTPCVAFSSRNLSGKYKGLAHATMPATVCWVGDRKARALSDMEDLCFHECVTGFPAKTLLRKPLAETHQLISIKCSVPGWCAPRPRLNTALFTDKYVWMGPEEHQLAFDKLFKQSCIIDASAFMVDSPSQVQARHDSVTEWHHDSSCLEWVHD